MVARQRTGGAALKTCCKLLPDETRVRGFPIQARA